RPKMVVSHSDDEAMTRGGAATRREPIRHDPMGTAQPLRLNRNEAYQGSASARASAELIAAFEKHFPGGPIIQAELHRPAEVCSLPVLFGPSGSGKSTTLRCLAGLERPERGSIRFGDEIWFDAERGIFLPPQRRRIGYLFQDYALFPHLRVAQNIGYG